MKKSYFVYILTNRGGTLYIGVTNDLLRRISEHKSGQILGFTQKYRINKLIYYEETPDVQAAIQREKQIKGWLREKKLNLIRSVNPKFEDLSADWFED